MTTLTRRSFLFRGAAGGFALSVRSVLFQGATGGLALSALPTLVAVPAEATPLAEALWTTVSWLGQNILVPATVNLFSKWLRSTHVVPAKPDDSFHGQFSPGVAFDQPFDATQTRYASYMGVQDFANVSHTPQLSRVGELNVAEIKELQNDSNPNLWAEGSLRRVPLNSSVRFVPTQFDVDRFYSDVERSGFNPNYVRLHYARTFCDCSTGTPMRGYGWSVANRDVGFRIMNV